ncbi:MAG: LPXTG cell wall anchor domain-containing protein, partial [Clostridia bacterium]|nr:LPXTG cell wall anchor domain-containing protein [Clostridia bacterium]
VKYIGSTGTQKIMPNGQEEYIIPVKNTQGYTLPSTGGAGTFRLTVSGLFCILLVTSIVLRRRMHR